MSSVELPLVSSARSSSSSASSSRSHLNSAGSTTSQKSSRSVRSHRSQQEDEDTYDEDAEEASKEEEPQESSGGLWDEVEHFLNKPSPSLSTLSGKASQPAANKLPKSTLPTIRKASPDNQNGHPGRAARAALSGPKAIDPKLLQEAFAYAQQIQQLNFDDDGDEAEQQQSWRSNKTKMLMQRAALGRANSSSSSLAGNAPRPGRAGSKGSVSDARKNKGKPAFSSVYSSAAKPKATMKKKRSTSEDPQAGVDAKAKGHMDPQTLQALVSNFQNGTTLDELRKELAASQQSMALSRQVLHDAAQNFFQSH